MNNMMQQILFLLAHASGWSCDDEGALRCDMLAEVPGTDAACRLLLVPSTRDKIYIEVTYRDVEREFQYPRYATLLADGSFVDGHAQCSYTPVSPEGAEPLLLAVLDRLTM